MALQRRETAILWTTVAVVVGAVLWLYGIQPIWDDYSNTRTALEEAEKTYEQNRKILAGRSKIEAEFDRIKKAIPREKTDEQSAKDAFQEDVNQLATQMLGSRPGLGVVTPEEMKDVPGFKLLSFEIRANGTLESIAKLLKAFDQRGYLIQQVGITQKNIDDPNLSLVLALARIVQIEEEKREERRSPFGAFGGRSR